MRTSKRLIGITLILIVLLTLSGCSQNEQEIFNAYLKMQNVGSMDKHINLSFKMSGEGFDTFAQNKIDRYALYLNNTKIDIDVKTSGNAQGNTGKIHVDANCALQGMSINIPYWIDMDNNSDTLKLTEIIKMPIFMSVSLPAKFASKEYMVINPFDMKGFNSNTLEMAKNIIQNKGLRANEVSFLTSYANRFKPSLDILNKETQNKQTNDGIKQAQIYEIKLSDAKFKELINYTVNSIMRDKEAINFIKEFLVSMIDLSQVADKQKAENDLEQQFKDYNPEQFLTVFNKVMDELKDTTILGDDGLVLQYAIADGYIINESGSINLKLDFSQLSQIMNTCFNQESISNDIKGTLNLTVNFSVDNSGINTTNVQIPQVNENNSFNYEDLLYYNSTPIWLAGRDRYQTARIIAGYNNYETVQDVIIVSGNNLNNALSVGVLARKLNAPILLVDSEVANSGAAISYISQYLSKSGTLHILSGTDVIGSEFETKFKELGINHIERIAGNDRFDVNVQIAQMLGVAKNTPIVIASRDNLPDAISILSIAGNKGYPILFVDKNNIAQGVEDFISGTQPAQVFIMGGTGIISKTNEAKIQALVPNGTITRLSGQDRYDTAEKIFNMFSLNPKNIYITSGNSITDALVGSVLASTTGDPIILIDPSSSKLSSSTEEYLKKLYNAKVRPKIYILGGRATVPYPIVRQVEGILKGTL